MWGGERMRQKERQEGVRVICEKGSYQREATCHNCVQNTTNGSNGFFVSSKLFIIKLDLIFTKDQRAIHLKGLKAGPAILKLQVIDGHCMKRDSQLYLKYFAN
ncbi:hypothetical protein SKAU_G00371140 [Synaphobranchus kaupii]|uniref:Uncharacterized protein n=1 Tax=Synaphobranchus kaupii TaxID=118154 RepID=A0A9Q1EG25_SYNKA|nr:hypothetical protein SKAU_G00371140 [Synaphobranchus kaupii]